MWIRMWDCSYNWVGMIRMEIERKGLKSRKRGNKVEGGWVSGTVKGIEIPNLIPILNSNTKSQSPIVRLTFYYPLIRFSRIEQRRPCHMMYLSNMCRILSSYILACQSKEKPSEIDEYFLRIWFYRELEIF